MERILRLHARAFPNRPRHEAAIFPALSRESAEALARGSLCRDEEEGWAGYVVEARVSTRVLEEFHVQSVGGRGHKRLCVPAARVSDLNGLLCCRLQIKSAWFGPKYVGPRTDQHPFRNASAADQFVALHRRLPMADRDLEEMILYHMPLFLLNHAWWTRMDLSEIGFSRAKTEGLLQQIARLWCFHYPELQLPEAG